MAESTSIKKTEGELKRVLKLPHLVVFGIAFMTPIAPSYIYGFVTETTGGMLASAYAVAMVGMMFTAFSYGKMANAFPYAGSAYTYVQRALHPNMGFMSGWGMYIDYILVPLIVTVMGATYLASWFLPYELWVIVLSLAIGAINYRGIKLAANTNNVLVALMTLAVIIYLIFCIRFLSSGGGEGTLLSSKPFYNPDNFTFGALFSGSAVACFSFLGFDGITTLAEETHNAKKNIGRGAVLACLFGGLFYILQAYITQLTWPDWTQFNNLETAYGEVSNLVGGPGLDAMFTAAILMSVFSAGIAGQASASRIMLGMGRDGRLPKKFFSHIHPKFNTPTNNIIVMTCIAIIGSIFLRMDFIVDLMSFGALFGFIFVNLSVIVFYFFKRKEKKVLSNFIFPGLGFVICTYLWINLASLTLIVGFAWILIGFTYLAISTKGFKEKVKIYEKIDDEE